MRVDKDGLMVGVPAKVDVPPRQLGACSRDQKVLEKMRSEDQLRVADVIVAVYLVAVFRPEQGYGRRRLLLIIRDFVLVSELDMRLAWPYMSLQIAGVSGVRPERAGVQDPLDCAVFGDCAAHLVTEGKNVAISGQSQVR